MQLTTSEKTTWYCYLVVHPITKVPIYVGMTADIASRTSAHTCETSRIRDWICELGEVDLVPEVEIVGRFNTKDEALDHEIKLINEIPGLLNKRSDRATGRPRFEERGKALEATRPWIKEGVSRSTWYRRQAEKRARL